MADNYDFLFRKRVIGSKNAPNLVIVHPLERNNGTPKGKLRKAARGTQSV